MIGFLRHANVIDNNCHATNITNYQMYVFEYIHTYSRALGSLFLSLGRRRKTRVNYLQATNNNNICVSFNDDATTTYNKVAFHPLPSRNFQCNMPTLQF